MRLTYVFVGIITQGMSLQSGGSAVAVRRCFVPFALRFHKTVDAQGRSKQSPSRVVLCMYKKK